LTFESRTLVGSKPTKLTMKQVVQDYRTGELTVDEVPAPALRPAGVLVRTICSLISAGTERTSVEIARSNLLSKARSRPDLVRQVYDTFRKEGFRATYEKVSARLNQVKALGYSASGMILEAGRDAGEFRPGDRVAIAGAGYASHSEVNYVPRNLCAKIPDGVSFETACYTTLGAIALQGVRQADPKLGEVVAVIGLGLVGQLTVQLLKAAGCRVLGVDIDGAACDLARMSGADSAEAGESLVRNAADLMTGGAGVDCVIITAATNSSDPIELGAELARDRARIVVVGLVGMNVPRQAFYNKELELRLSRSYGPGRYDTEYEEKGRDYPVGYVRWTERRNMEAFLQLAGERKVNTDLLTTHRFPVSAAQQAYGLILSRAQRYCGVVLDYPEKATPLPPADVRKSTTSSDELGISFIGAGNFARGVLLPALKRNSKVRLAGVSAATGISAKNTATQFGFEYVASGAEEILNDEGSDVVFIATRHDLHASIAAKALRKGKAVFVEKPLAIDEVGLKEVAIEAVKSRALLMAGFNRRFAPTSVDLRQRLTQLAAPMTICYRVNAGRLPADHWTLDAEEGGGRIIGEACHFIDFAQYLTGALPITVGAQSVSRTRQDKSLDDSVVITLALSDGSVASIIYAASGPSSVAKERVEVFCHGAYALIDDFRTGRFVQNGSESRLGGNQQDKGHSAEVGLFLEAVRNRGPSPIALESLVATTLASFAAVESASRNHTVEVDSRNYLSKLVE
jgi:predicted dehydrogenase/threonine dehydrogenase-like Zn-dependent dehydrogenase